jgi:hypothetical protein
MQGAFKGTWRHDIHCICKVVIIAVVAPANINQGSREENHQVSEHVYRTGYHFRETIFDEAREIVGETAVSSNKVYRPDDIEPIPESQEEINKQADAAIRDLFPRIPNTDRQMIIDHAFRKASGTYRHDRLC